MPKDKPSKKKDKQPATGVRSPFAPPARPENPPGVREITENELDNVSGGAVPTKAPRPELGPPA